MNVLCSLSSFLIIFSYRLHEFYRDPARLCNYICKDKSQVKKLVILFHIIFLPHYLLQWMGWYLNPIQKRAEKSLNTKARQALIQQGSYLWGLTVSAQILLFYCTVNSSTTHPTCLRSDMLITEDIRGLLNQDVPLSPVQASDEQLSFQSHPILCLP